ncbi:addiction module protein [candidate division KSB1 bacterium]|nr:addiction module protein [candidate division KSB1 bacterium]
MSTVIESIVAQALRMPPKDRAIIAERSISSLDTEVDWDVEVAWQQEVQRRIEKIDKGEVVCLPWEQVLQRLRENGRVTT